MKKGIFKSSLLVLSLLIISCSKQEEPNLDKYLNPEEPAVENIYTNDPDASWELVFEDNFDSNLSNWNIWESGAFNEEIQFYREEQLSLEDSLLKINIQRQNISGPTTPFNNTTKSFEYVSGRIESKELFGPSVTVGEQQYRFIARIKMPYGHGFWPAFWSYGDPWPTKGEIDIIEAKGDEPNNYISNLFYGDTPNNVGEIKNENYNTHIEYTVTPNISSSFNEYEVIWSSHTIEIYFNGNLLYTYENAVNNNVANFFGKKHKLVLNTAVGGWFISDKNSLNFADSGEMQVDWVRVYKR